MVWPQMKPFHSSAPSKSLIRGIVYTVFLAVSGSSVASAARPVLAIPAFSGSKKSGVSTFEKALTTGFSKQRLDVVNSDKLRKIAKKTRSKAQGNYVAELAGADYKLSVRIRSRKRGYQLTAQLVELLKGKTIESAKWNYRPTKRDRQASLEDNAEKAADAIVKKFMAKLDKSFPRLVGDNAETAAELPQ